MADKRIDAHTNTTTVADVDEFIVDSGSNGTRNVTYSNLKDQLLGTTSIATIGNSVTEAIYNVHMDQAVPKYDAANRREYYEGGSAFSGNIDSVPTAGSNNAVASGGTYTAINERVKCGVFTTPDQTIAANTHLNINYIPATLPSTTIGMCIMDSPNSAWIFAHVREFSTTYVSLGIFNTASSSLTGKFKILYFYT